MGGKSNIANSISHAAAKRLMQLIVDKSVAEFGNEPPKESSPLYWVKTPPLPIALLMLLNPAYWIPEAYCRGHWHVQSGDLADLLTIAQDEAPARFRAYMSFTQHPYSINHLFKQKLFTRYFSRMVRTHYEILPDIYRSFLDDEMVYTCAFFDANDTVESAQQRKFSIILDRLELTDKANLLNIGCGWGSFERFVVRKRRDVQITGLSISESQVAWANKHNSAMLENGQLRRVRLLTEDYAHHQHVGCYDSVTAIGMVEHVGQSGYPEFFRRSYDFLKPKGTLLVHMIVKAESNVPTNKWIDRYIFPGGYSPSISELTRGAERSGFRIKNVHIHHPENYARTLLFWREKLRKNKSSLVELYVNKFNLSDELAEYMFRQWEFYFAASESSFRVKDSPLQVAQFVFEKYAI